MAAVGASLAVIIVLCLVGIGLLAHHVKSHNSDWKKLSEASVFRSNVSFLPHREPQDASDCLLLLKQSMVDLKSSVKGSQTHDGSQTRNNAKAEILPLYRHLCLKDQISGYLS